MMRADDAIDAEAVAEQQRKIDELRRELLKAGIELRNQIRGVLTAEQRQQLRARAPWRFGS